MSVKLENKIAYTHAGTDTVLPYGAEIVIAGRPDDVERPSTSSDRRPWGASGMDEPRRVTLELVLLAGGLVMAGYAGYLQYAELPEAHTFRNRAKRCSR